MSSQDNRKRALAEAVSLDAWHKSLTPTIRKADLFVDVGFLDGRVGGNPGEEVTFRLRIRRASVVVIVPPTEPLEIEKESIRRDRREVTVKSKKITKQKNTLGIGTKGSVNLIQSRLVPTAGVTVEGGYRKDAETQLTETTEYKQMHVEYLLTPEGYSAWEIKPATAKTLLGSPWNPKESPLLRLADRRSKTDGIEAAVQVEVRCRREDLEISDIKYTENGVWKTLKSLSNNKRIAAEAVLRTRLFQAGLIRDNVDLSNRFSYMTLYSVIAENT